MSLPGLRSLTRLLFMVASISTLAGAVPWKPGGHVQYTSNPIPNHYIIQYHHGTNIETRRKHEVETHNFAVSMGDYRGVMKRFQIGDFSAYHGEFHPDHIEQLRANSPQIKAIHPDEEVRLTSHSPKKNPKHPQHPDLDKPHAAKGPHHHDPNKPHEAKKPPTPQLPPNIHIAAPGNWGQARLSHRDLPKASARYIYERPDTTVYVIDSGIVTSHWQFATETGGSRAYWGANFANDKDEDEIGHGTHVAGIIGGKTVGVAPNTKLIAVKIFGSEAVGSWSTILQGLEWAGNDTARRGGASRTVVNLSLGGGAGQCIDDAVTALSKNHSITVVVAAGNDNNATEYYSPARCPAVITVGSIGRTDHRSSFSNWGPEVDVFAPGEDILSAFISEDGDVNATRVCGGTSMASPFVAGLAAYFLDLYGPMGPERMRGVIEHWATKGKVKDVKGSKNWIAFNGVEGRWKGFDEDW
ncbi:peptidase S8/S53 domain-containing protein [Cercophora newfieldiana]|uniref:Peptidase S8/S53 domain-containing protein n=1 Tax=Cercophora newfieldiana TaxID=92897 RepID=A0AA40D1P7_9PEZI|nr:peptidase S8/S53 domain-containing protein [Cercophora newfieldiana]